MWSRVTSLFSSPTYLEELPAEIIVMIGTNLQSTDINNMLELLNLSPAVRANLLEEINRQKYHLPIQLRKIRNWVEQYEDTWNILHPTHPVHRELLANQIKNTSVNDPADLDCFKYNIMGNVLHFCSDDNLTELMKIVLMFPEVNPDPNDRFASFLNTFLYACHRNRCDIVEIFMVDGRVLENVKYNQSIAYEFMTACEAGNTKLVQLILKYGFNPSCEPLLYVCSAMKKKHNDIVKLLLTYDPILKYAQKHFPEKIQPYL